MKSGNFLTSWKNAFFCYSCSRLASTNFGVKNCFLCRNAGTNSIHGCKMVEDTVEKRNKKKKFIQPKHKWTCKLTNGKIVVPQRLHALACNGLKYCSHINTAYSAVEMTFKIPVHSAWAYTGLNFKFLYSQISQIRNAFGCANVD